MDVYVMKDGSRQGPFPPFRLTEMLEDGSLSVRDLVWHDGMEQWSELSDTPSLSAVMKTAAPPVAAEQEEGEFQPPPPPVRQLSAAMVLHITRERRRLAWRRFFARQIDVGLAVMLAIGAASVTGLSTAWEMLTGWTGPVSIAAGWLLVESLLLATWGTTPGRALLGIRVFLGDDQKPPFVIALKRSALVLAAGAALGLPIPPLLIAQWMFSYWQFQKLGTTLWDKTCGTRVAYRPLTGLHAGGIAVFMAALFAFSIWFKNFSPLPTTLSKEERDIIEQSRKDFFDAVNKTKQADQPKPAPEPTPGPAASSPPP